MKKAAIVGGAVGAVVMFAVGFGTGFAVKGDGESSTPTSAPVDATVAPVRATTTSAVPTPATNARGAYDKNFGDQNGLGCATRPCDVEFVVGAPIEPTACGSDYPVENGRLIALPIAVETKAGADLSPYSGMWNPHSFSAVLASGITKPGVTSAAAYGCAESDKTIPDRMAPASRYEGFVVLDVPTDAVSIQFLPHQADGGWEWSLV